MNKKPDTEIQEWPSLTIIIPSFNQGRFIERTIQSILKQNYPGKLQVIVSDGGSKDETVSILQKYPQLEWWSKPDKGFVDAVNKGLLVAKGKYIAIQSSDDFYFKNAFQRAIMFLEKNPDYGFVTGSDAYIMDTPQKIAFGKKISVEIRSPRQLILSEVTIHQHCTFVRKELVDNVGGLRMEVDRCSDADLWYRILHFNKGFVLPQYFGIYQIHSAQRTQAKPELWINALKRMVDSCETNELFSSRFRLNAQEKQDAFLRIELFWRSYAGFPDEQFIAVQLAKRITETPHLHSAWLIKYANNFVKQISFQKKGRTYKIITFYYFKIIIPVLLVKYYTFVFKYRNKRNKLIARLQSLSRKPDLFWFDNGDPK